MSLPAFLTLHTNQQQLTMIVSLCEATKHIIIPRELSGHQLDPLVALDRVKPLNVSD